MPQAAAPARHVILVVFDTLRRDAVEGRNADFACEVVEPRI